MVALNYWLFLTTLRVRVFVSLNQVFSLRPCLGVKLCVLGNRSIAHHLIRERGREVVIGIGILCGSLLESRRLLLRATM